MYFSLGCKDKNYPLSWCAYLSRDSFEASGTWSSSLNWGDWWFHSQMAAPMLTCYLRCWCDDILVFLPCYFPEWWEGESTSCSAVLSFCSSWLTGELEFLICNLSDSSSDLGCMSSVPLRAAQCYATSLTDFSSLGRPSKDPVSAGLISGRKTKYDHLLEENVFATLLKFHTVVCSWLSPGSWSWYWSERFYWTLILWGSRVCQTSLQGVLWRKCGRKEKKINSATVGEKKFSAFFFLLIMFWGFKAPQLGYLMSLL